MSEQEKLIVTQRAREAAADFVEFSDPLLAHELRNGEQDGMRVVQSFARFEQLIIARPGNAEVEGLVERLRLYTSWRDSHGELNNAPNEAADMLATLSSGLVAAESEERWGERDFDQILTERDDAEEAISQAYYLVTGNSPEWSNLFNYPEALEDIKDAINLLKDACKTTSPNASVTPEPANLAGENKGPFPDISPYGEIGRRGSPDAYLIDPGAGSGSDKVTRYWPTRGELDNIHRRGGSITPLYGSLNSATSPNATSVAGRVEVGPDDPLYKALRPSPETIAAIEENEAANAAGLIAIRDMMVGHVTNWPNPKKFGTAMALIDKTLHAALSSPDRIAEWQGIESAPRDGTRFLAYEGGDCYAAEWNANCECWSAFCGQYVTSAPDPTHWCPLPAPPRAVKDEG